MAGSNKILVPFVITHSDTQLVVQFVFRFATLLQITRLTVRRIGWRYSSSKAAIDGTNI